MTDKEKLPGWLKEAAKESAEKISGSDIFLGLFSGNCERDALFCLQLGIAVLLDKPIVIMALGGVPIPGNLLKIAKAVDRVDTPGEMDEGRLKALFDSVPVKK